MTTKATEGHVAGSTVMGRSLGLVSVAALALAAAWACGPSSHGGGGAVEPSEADASPAEATVEETPDANLTPAAVRSWEVYAGELKLLDIRDEPGLIIDTTAPPPPPVPGWVPPRHPFLTASCGGDPLLCSRAGTLLRESQSTDEFLDQLRAEGWRVEAAAPAP
jgi:hypothetical protein